MMNGITGITIAVNPETAAKKSEEMVSAARQFEALLIAQMLRSMREAGGDGGWLGTGEDPTAASAMEMAEEQFAATLAAQGGLGLAKMVAEGLAHRTAAMESK